MMANEMAKTWKVDCRLRLLKGLDWEVTDSDSLKVRWILYQTTDKTHNMLNMRNELKP